MIPAGESVRITGWSTGSASASSGASPSGSDPGVPAPPRSSHEAQASPWRGGDRSPGCWVHMSVGWDVHIGMGRGGSQQGRRPNACLSSLALQRAQLPRC